MLESELFRAARLVVDTGLHALGWPPERARRYLASLDVLSCADEKYEVTRYLALPGQALAYSVGLRAWRAAAARADDPASFYARALREGPVPLEQL